MTKNRTRFLLTASELAMGRVMRAPDHDATTAGGEAAPAPASAPAKDASDDDFAAFERKVTAPKPKVDDALPAADDTDHTPPAGENGTGEDDGDPESGDKPHKGKSVQERMNEITAARREAERERDEALRKLAEASPKPEVAKPAVETPSAEADLEPDPTAFEYGEADPKFTLEMAKWGARQEFKALRESEAIKAQVAETSEKWDRMGSEAVEKYPDFKEKVLDTAKTVEWPCSPIVGEGILNSEVGTDIAYHLATNVDEAKAIYAMNPLEQARAFGRLEAKFIGGTSKAAAPTPKITTDAPKPPENRARGGGGKYAVDDDTNDFSAFEAKHSRKGK